MVREKYIERDGKRYKLVRKGKYVEVNKTKSHRFLATKILSVFFVLFVAAPLGITFGLFYDSSTKDVSAVNDENITDTLTNRLFNAINNITANEEKKETKFTLTFDEQTLDSMLTQVNHQFMADTPVGDYIPKFYCTINGNKYNFYADIQSGFFKTRATIRTTLEKVNDSDPTLKFTINSIDLGRLSIKTGFIGSIVSNFVNADMINQALEKVHFAAKFDFNAMALSYPRSQFKDDVRYWLDEASKKFAEMNLVFKMLGESTDAIETDYTNGVKVGLNLYKFGTTKIPGDLNLNLKTTVSVASDIVDSGLETTKTVDEAKETLTEFINYGLTRLNENDKEFITNNAEKIDVKCKEKIENYTSAENWTTGKIEKVNDKLLDSTNVQNFVDGKDDLVIKPDDINSYLNHFKIIGKTIQLGSLGNSKLKNTYVSLNNFKFAVDNGQLCCFVGADLNGIINVNARIPINNGGISIKDGQICIKVDDKIKIGEIEVNQDTISTICAKFDIDDSVFKFRTTKNEKGEIISSEFYIPNDLLKGLVGTKTGTIDSEGKITFLKNI